MTKSVRKWGRAERQGLKVCCLLCQESLMVKDKGVKYFVVGCCCWTVDRPTVKCSAHGSSKTENYSPDRATSRVVVEVNWRRTRRSVRKSAFHDVDYAGPQNRSRENNTGSLSPIRSRSHCCWVFWRQRCASGVVS